jgi:hypothetical protein
MKFVEYLNEKLLHKEIMNCVKYKNWQEFRESLKGLSTSVKLKKVKEWVKKKDSKCAKIQATNYINALKRGGLV